MIAWQAGVENTLDGLLSQEWAPQEWAHLQKLHRAARIGLDMLRAMAHLGSLTETTIYYV